jgi:hypothetical protein
MAVFTTSGVQTFAAVEHISNTVFADLQTDINAFITGTLDADADNYYSVDVKYLPFDGTNYNASVFYVRYEIDPDYGVEA